jgi:hypothetical protein
MLLVAQPKEVKMYESYNPWLTEPDEWFSRDDNTGYATMILRNRMGALCGYVGVPVGHPLYGLPYYDWNATTPEQEAVNNIEVHGGLTFAGQGRRAPDEYKDYWWFGFDCAHAGDYVPVRPDVMTDFGCKYRDMKYVKEQIALLAKQIHAISGATGSTTTTT